MIPIDQKDTTELRFKIGDRVECNCGQWTAGQVVKLFYTQSSFPPGQCAPYQIRLEDGRLIYSPADEDRVIRAAAEPGDPGYVAPEDPEAKEADKLPVTVITGFLGAGKTTMVNYILREQNQKKICVIENEFGSVSIDTALVKENLSAAEEIITMDNGCACCTVRGDLVKAFNSLKSRKDDFDLILLETTGLADPAPIIKTLTADWSLQNNFRIDGVVCLVDVKHVLEHINEVRDGDSVNEAVQQVAFSNRIMLNKIDLVTPEQLQVVKETIHSINSFAELIECKNSVVPMDKLTNINAFSLEQFEAGFEEYDMEEAEACSDETCTDESHAHSHAEAEHGHAEAKVEHGHAEAEVEHGHAEHGHAEVEAEHGHAEHGHAEEVHEHGHAEKKTKKKTHDLSGVGSVALLSINPLISEKFNRFMTTLLQKDARNLFRSKGVLMFHGEGNKKFVFQGVHEDIQFTEAPNDWTDADDKISKVVLIGRGLNKAELEVAFKECQANPNQRAAGADKQGFFS